jgi:hypothetical protein
MQLGKLNNKKFFLVLLVFFLIILKFFDTPYNLYSILNWNYNERMEQKYGNCKNESWGFYKTISDKFNLERDNIKIINEEGHVTLENLFNIKKDNSNDTKYFILLNYKSKNNESIFNGKYKFIKNYKIKFRENNCYLMERND